MLYLIQRKTKQGKVYYRNESNDWVSDITKAKRYDTSTVENVIERLKKAWRPDEVRIVEDK